MAKNKEVIKPMETKNLTLVNNKQELTPTEVMKNLDPADRQVIKNTVARGASDSELSMFLTLASRYGLDPFQKEIWCIKRGPNEPATIMTSRDGYLKVAQNNPDFIGLISFVVCEGDEFKIDASNYNITHSFGAKRGKILGAWARCDRKGRNAQICYVPFNEYMGNSPTWKKYPSAMIQKVAEVFVLKRQFGVSGLVTTEEIDYEIDDSQVTYYTPEATETPSSQEPSKKEPITVDAEYSEAPSEAPKEEPKKEKPKNTKKKANKEETLYKVKGLRPSPAQRGASELALENQKGENAVVFVLGDMATKILDELGIEDIIKAEIVLKNGLNVLENYTLAQKKEKEKAKNSSVELLAIGHNKEKGVLALKLKGKEEFVAYTNNQELINSVGEELTSTNAGPGSKVEATLTQREDGKIIFTSFKVVEAKKVVSA